MPTGGETDAREWVPVAECLRRLQSREIKDLMTMVARCSTPLIPRWREGGVPLDVKNAAASLRHSSPDSRVEASWRSRFLPLPILRRVIFPLATSPRSRIRQ
jgi:hypothetical protein